MNMQAMIKQAQSLQKDMMKVKEQIDSTEFVGECSFVKVTMNGAHEAVNIQIDSKSLDENDIEALQDMLLVAINDAKKKIDKETEKKMGKFGNIPGLF